MRLSVIAICLSVWLIGISLAGDANASIREDTSIPAEGLGVALHTLARDRDFQIIYVSEEIENVPTQGAVGKFTPEEALKRLLSGTGLTYRYLDDKTVTIVSVTETTSLGVSGRASSGSSGDSDSTQEWKKGSAGGFRTAQVSQGANPESSSMKVDSQDSSRFSGSSRNIEENIEEIVVTAQRREERLIDVPISIVALSGDDLQKRNITDIDDLPAAVPGLAVIDNGALTRQIVLRGISNFATGNSSLIGMYLDEATVTSAASSQLDLRTYDLERIEVLRGPQGTLYGEGSVGGTIRFITKNPQLEQFAVDIGVATDFTQNGGPSQRIQEVINVPLIDNVLGIRVAGEFDHEGGWINQPLANQTNINSQDLADIRTKVLWEPVEAFAATAMVVIHRNNEGPNQGEDPNGNYSQTFGLTTTPRVQDNYNIYNLALTYNLTTARILSTTSYITQDKTLNNGGYDLPLNPPPAEQYSFYYFNENFLVRNFNQEFRITSTGSEPWQWTVGGFYQWFEASNNNPHSIFDTLRPTAVPLSDYYSYSYQQKNISKSSAFFGDTSYQLMKRLTFGVGLRYFEDEQEFAIGSGLFGAPYPLGTNQTGRFHALSPRAYAEYKLTDSANTYASAAKGFRSGGINGADLPTYGPEDVWTYELGMKTTLMESRLSFNTAVFLSNYTNYQIIGFPPPPALPIDVVRNAGTAKIKGVEWDLTSRPTDQWTLEFSGDYLDARFTEINVLAAAYNVEDPVDLVPRYQYTLSAQRNFKLSDRPGFARVDYNQQGPETYRNRNADGSTPYYTSNSDTIHMLNGQASLQWTDSLSLGFIVRNLLNDRGYTNPFSIYQSAARPRPRTFGLQFNAKFH